MLWIFVHPNEIIRSAKNQAMVSSSATLIHDAMHMKQMLCSVNMKAKKKQITIIFSKYNLHACSSRDILFSCFFPSGFRTDGLAVHHAISCFFKGILITMMTNAVDYRPLTAQNAINIMVNLYCTMFVFPYHISCAICVIFHRNQSTRCCLLTQFRQS